MIELKKKVTGLFGQVYADWNDALKKAQENDGFIDLSEIMVKQSEIMKQLDSHFLEAQERIRKSRKFLGVL